MWRWNRGRRVRPSSVAEELVSSFWPFGGRQATPLPTQGPNVGSPSWSGRRPRRVGRAREMGIPQKATPLDLSFRATRGIPRRSRNQVRHLDAGVQIGTSARAVRVQGNQHRMAKFRLLTRSTRSADRGPGLPAPTTIVNGKPRPSEVSKSGALYLCPIKGRPAALLPVVPRNLCTN